MGVSGSREISEGCTRFQKCLKDSRGVLWGFQMALKRFQMILNGCRRIQKTYEGFGGFQLRFQGNKEASEVFQELQRGLSIFQ